MTLNTTAAEEWRLVNELGFESAPSPAAGPQLCFPVFAAKTPDGGLLIGDELGTSKLVPFRFESRTLLVSPTNEITYDSTLQGIDDGIGCLLDRGFTAILRRTKWELQIVSPQGVVTECLPLWPFSKRMPRYVSWTDRGTFLIVFCNRVREVDIIEVDRQGRLLWFLPPQSGEIGLAGSVQWLPSDTFLIADPFRHVVVEIDRDGSVVWRFGEVDQPSLAVSRLAGPASARVMPDGKYLVADMRNHRLLLIGRDGTSSPVTPDDGGFCDPMYASPLDDGNLLVCDTGNRRVVEMEMTGRIVRELGNAAPQKRFLSYPRSVEFSGDGKYVVADTANDRIMEFAAGQVRELPVRIQPPLFWPRCARILPSGGLLIADGRSGRILEVAADGSVLRELCKIDMGDDRAFGDPHEVRLLPNDHLLIVDSSQDLVVEADWSGRVYRRIGEQGELTLSDPHSAQQIDDGCLLIADTGNHRILFIAADGTCIRQLHAIESDSCCYRLNFPRYVEVIEDGTMVIADTGNNRILAATTSGKFLWEFSVVPGTRIGQMNQPRWARLISRNEVVVCDHSQHRILHVKREHAN